MNKEVDLTIKLKELGVEIKYEKFFEVYELYTGRIKSARFLKKPENEIALWTIESALAWLREKGWKYRWTPYYIGYAEWLKIEVAHQGGNLPFIADVYPGHELGGLLECMVKIVEGKR